MDCHRMSAALLATRITLNTTTGDSRLVSMSKFQLLLVNEVKLIT